MLCGCCVMHVCAGRMTAPPLSQRYLSYGKVICGGHSPIFDDHYSYTRTWQAVSRRKPASTRSTIRVLRSRREHVYLQLSVFSPHFLQCGCISDRGWSIDDRRRLQQDGSVDVHRRQAGRRTNHTDGRTSQG